MTDIELIEKVKSGNENAFRILVERYEKKIAKVVIGLLGNTVEAEDVGQEVFVRFFRKINAFKGESSLGTYLTRIAINLSLNEIKRQKRRQWLLFSLESPSVKSQKSTHFNYENTDFQAIILSAIQRLKADFRVVAVLRFVEEYSAQETADLLKLPLGTVQSRTARARERLRELLKKYVDNE
ncbi:MAG: sigma-70 family RNA polymerase sigma factor [Microscillaceae bacterium]|nr:sigma-70 family RNA polymerase sigma factor [Microscillaceae bacterium]